MGNIGIWQLLIVVVIVVIFFGTKKLRNLGSDLGASVKGFKKAMSDDEVNPEKKPSSSESADDLASLTATKESSSEKEQDKV